MQILPLLIEDPLKYGLFKTIDHNLQFLASYNDHNLQVLAIFSLLAETTVY